MELLNVIIKETINTHHFDKEGLEYHSYTASANLNPRRNPYIKVEITRE